MAQDLVGRRVDLAGHFVGAVTVEDARPLGNGVELRVRLANGDLDETVLSPEDLTRLEANGSGPETAPASPADAEKLRLLVESARIRLAYAYDHQFAVSLSGIRTLPHQIEAVYLKMLPQPRLRFLLADDPGAGKTIMAGLLIKELKLRQAIDRCLILVPAPLTIQWQDELLRFFGEPFHIVHSATDQQQFLNPWEREPQVIASIDYAKQDAVRERVWQQRWDLVIIDEAHKCSAYTKRAKGRDEVERTKRYQLAERLSDRCDNLLMLTATPHHGNDDRFAHFIRLLDRDLFPEPHRLGPQAKDIRRDILRLGEDCPWALRRLKEDLKDTSGRRLFPNRQVSTVSFSLSAAEYAIYQAVSAYINEYLPQTTGRRQNSVALARTVFQRRLASSTRAIHQSLIRRRKKLQDMVDELDALPPQERARRLAQLQGRLADAEQDEDDLDEAARDDLANDATAAVELDQLRAEIAALADLTDRVARDGEEVQPAAYIWARTVPCARPGCAAPVPLVRQAWLRKKNGAVASIPRVEGGDKLRWRIVSGKSVKDVSEQAGQTGAGQAVCVACGTPAPTAYAKEMAVNGRMGESLAALVVKRKRSKLYVDPTACATPDSQSCARRLAQLLRATGLASLDEGMNTEDSTTVAGRGWGIKYWRELYTPRQLVVLFTLIKHIRTAHKEMLTAGMNEEKAKALATYLAMAFSRLALCFNKFTRWSPKYQITMGAIGDRQAIKMVYDFSEINCLAKTQGCLPFALDRELFCMRELAKVRWPATVTRGDAGRLPYEDATFDAVVTDPPYYDSIYYADLSAFFYVWLRRILGDLHPEHFTLPTPPKRREAVAQPSEHDGDVERANLHYQDMMRRAFAEARRVLKPGAPLLCVYAHRTTEGWTTLIRALVDAGMTVTEVWPVQTESSTKLNALGAAALSSSIFFVSRRREDTATVGQYETQVEPELQRIARERVTTLWAGGQGIGGADLLMAAVGAGLAAYTRFVKVEYANGEPVPAERYLREVEGVVLDVMLDEIFGMRGSAVGTVDRVTCFYILWRFTYRESSVEAGDVYVFSYPQGVEVDGPNGLAGPSPALVEKQGKKFRVRNYQERGAAERLGMARDAALIDVVHRILWLIDERPTELQDFLQSAQPNQEALRLVAQALCAPALAHSTSPDKPTDELSALSKLNANWQQVVEGSALAQPVESGAKDQTELAFRSAL